MADDVRPVNPARIADSVVDPLFIDRWSPRSFSADEIGDDVLAQIFEAARWAPSASNSQPWRFVVVKRASSRWAEAVALLNEQNRHWAQGAAALIFIASTTVINGPNGARKSRSHSFDAGAAWAHLALQAHLLGWATHAIGGFDRESAPGAFGAHADLNFEAAVAIGRRGPAEALPDHLRAREQPNQRRAVREFVFFDRFSEPESPQA